MTSSIFSGAVPLLELFSGLCRNDSAVLPPSPAKRAHLIAESNLVRLPVIRPTSWSHELANLAVIVLSRSHDGEDEALTVATVS